MSQVRVLSAPHVSVPEWSNGVDCKSIVREFESHPALNIMIDNKELATYLLKRIKEYQSDESIRKTVPMSYPYGIYFTSDDLEFWIQQYQLRHCAGHFEWSEKFKKNMWVEDK